MFLKKRKMNFRVFSSFTVFYTLIHSIYLLFYEWLKFYCMYKLAGDGTGDFFVTDMSDERISLYRYYKFTNETKSDAYTTVSVLSVIAIALLLCYLVTHLPKISATIAGILFAIGTSRVFLYVIGSVDFYPGHELGFRPYGAQFATEWAMRKYTQMNAMEFAILGFCVYLIVKLLHACTVAIIKKKRGSLQ